MIRLYSYKNNFGDDLSPYIISKLSGQKVLFNKPFTMINLVIDFLRFVKKALLKAEIDTSLLRYNPFNKVVLGIGSILQESTSNCLVWGSGLASKDINIKGGKFLAVRGPLSQKRLDDLGYKVPSAIGDPALLLPLVYPSKKNKLKKRYNFGIIPHKNDYNDIYAYFKKKELNNYLIIDLVEPNLEKVIDQFLSCDHILSTSLHGLIVAHAYGIPAIWFEKNILLGDGSKFKDYFLSIGIKPYQPNSFNELDFSNADYITELFDKNKKNSLPRFDVKNIQNDLIQAAPFHIQNKFKSI
jgi:hypothetical protein